MLVLPQVFNHSIIYLINNLIMSEDFIFLKVCFNSITQPRLNFGRQFRGALSPLFLVSARGQCSVIRQGFESLHIDEYTVIRTALTEHQNE